MNRDDVIAKHSLRRSLETMFKRKVILAKEELHPHAIGSRFIKLQKRKLIERRDYTSKFARENAPWIIAGSLVSLLIAARSPIMKRVNGLRKRAANAEDQE